MIGNPCFHSLIMKFIYEIQRIPNLPPLMEQERGHLQPLVELFHPFIHTEEPLIHSSPPTRLSS